MKKSYAGWEFWHPPTKRDPIIGLASGHERRTVGLGGFLRWIHSGNVLFSDVLIACNRGREWASLPQLALSDAAALLFRFHANQIDAIQMDIVNPLELASS